MRVLMPIPDTDFDPTETAVPWQHLTRAGVKVVIATQSGEPGQADPRMVEGTGLGPWRGILRAAGEGREAYAAMVESPEHRDPISWDDIQPEDYDGLLLPGGHAKGMRPYLESEKLQSVAAHFMEQGAPLGAICHGVVLLSRAQTEDGRSVLTGRTATALLKSQEMSAWLMTGLWLKDYYRTYSTPVEAEVRAALGESGEFQKGSFALLRDDPSHLDRGFVVRDGNLVTARWPGDAHRFSMEFEKVLRQRAD